MQYVFILTMHCLEISASDKLLVHSVTINSMTLTAKLDLRRGQGKPAS